MIVTPKGAPASTPQAQGESPRDRAMAKLTGGSQQAEQPPVQNQNQVSPEEFSAILAKKKLEDGTDPTGDPVQEGLEESKPLEAAAEDTKAPEAKDPLSSQYAVLARKEKALRAQVQKFNAERDAFKAEQAGKPATPTFDESKYIAKDKLATKDWNTLNELGFTYDDLTNLALNPPSAQDSRTVAMIDELKAEIKALRGDSDKTKKSFEEQQTQQYQQAVNQIRNEAKNLVNSNEAFETIKETGSVDEVVRLIEETFKADGTLLSVEEAAQAVEEHLVEEATRLARLKKVQAKLQPQQAKPLESGQKPVAGQPAAKTLTNAIGSTRKLSPRERAHLAFEGKLQKS